MVVIIQKLWKKDTKRRKDREKEKERNISNEVKENLMEIKKIQEDLTTRVVTEEIREHLNKIEEKMLGNLLLTNEIQDDIEEIREDIEVIQDAIQGKISDEEKKNSEDNREFQEKLLENMIKEVRNYDFNDETETKLFIKKQTDHTKLSIESKYISLNKKTGSFRCVGLDTVDANLKKNNKCF